MTSDAAAMWGGADYELVAEQFAPIHDDLVGSLTLRPGERFLDVATGTGEVAIRAARQGVEVTALDFAPRMLAQARAKAESAGLAVDWVEGDAQELPFADGRFDVVASCFGVIFAPEPERAAAELARVSAPGARLRVTAWLPNHGLHRLYARFSPEEDEDPSERWGSREGLRELLEGRFELEVEDRIWNLEAASPEEAWEVVSTGAPPVKALLDSLERDRQAEFRAAMLEYWEDFRTNDGVREPRGYLLALGRRR